ncbi:MAG: hypothetical protein COA99_01785 [Moraxellaceae bacterium]|nr:MAG: hypothetical protein COA99_01785 [Moraxellaceae bacterium]
MKVSDPILKSAACFLLFLFTYSPNAALSAVPITSSSTISSHKINGYIGWRSDYVYRGVTLSQNQPSIQASLQYNHVSGAFINGWVSQTKVKQARGPEGESNLSLGYKLNIDIDWSSYCMATHYSFIGGKLGFDSEFYEYVCGVNYQDRIQFNIAYSDNSYGLNFHSTLYEVRHTYPLTPTLSYSTHIGHWDISDFVGSAYDFIHTGLQHTYHQFNSYIFYHWASSVATDTYGDDANPGWLAAFSYHF